MVTPEYGSPAGGVGRHVAELARRVAAAGHDVEVLTHGRGPLSGDVPIARGVRVRRFPSPAAAGDYAVSAELWTHLRLHGAHYDLLHAHGYRTLPALLASRAALPRLVFTPHWHRAAATRARRLVHPLYRRLGVPAFERADVVICVSGAEEASVLRVAPAVEGRTHVIPDAADVAAIRAAGAASQRHLGRLILSVGGLDDGRGVARVISALPALPEAFALAVVGDGPARGSLRDHAADLGVAQRVRFLGRLGDAAYYRRLRAADVVAAMAEATTCGLSLFEACAAGVPVVASDVDVHREAAELVGAGVRLISLQASPLALADELEAAAERAAGTPAAAIPTWDSVADLTVALYERCVGGAPAAQRAVVTLPAGAA